jgi:hypothetical protein
MHCCLNCCVTKCLLVKLPVYLFKSCCVDSSPHAKYLSTYRFTFCKTNINPTNCMLWLFTRRCWNNVLQEINAIKKTSVLYLLYEWLFSHCFVRQVCFKLSVNLVMTSCFAMLGKILDREIIPFGIMNCCFNNDVKPAIYSVLGSGLKKVSQDSYRSTHWLNYISVRLNVVLRCHSP